MSHLGAKYSQTQKEWSRTQADQSKTFDRLQTMEEKGRLQDSSIDQMSKLIQAQERQIRELKETKGKLDFQILELKQKKFETQTGRNSGFAHDSQTKNTDMLNELNGLID